MSEHRGRRVARCHRRAGGCRNVTPANAPPALDIGNLSVRFTHRDGAIAAVLVHHSHMSWREAEKAALRALERVRVPEAQRRLRQYPHELSGGMRQRVMIGMSLLCEPKLLIADEPTTALDVTVQAQIMEILRAMRAESLMAIVLISHDLGVVAGLADRIVVMYAGRVVESADAADILGRAMHPHTAASVKC